MAAGGFSCNPGILRTSPGERGGEGEGMGMGGEGGGVKNLGNGWSKSIVLGNKVVINFNFRRGAKKSGHLNYPLQSFTKSWFTLVHHKLDQNKKYFH